jgi:histidine triad (HIT) family protein
MNAEIVPQSAQSFAHAAPEVRVPGRYSHQPAGYDCPFCRTAAGQDCEANWAKQTDVVWRDELVTAFINSAFWPNNPGHVLVIPNAHFENVYDVSDEALAAVQIAGKRIALALKAAYGCDGTSFRQHNEPAGYQEVWHYHLHVFPRYHGDDLYLRSRERRFVTPAEREPYAARLRAVLGQ